MMSYKNFLITIFFLASCSNEVSDNQQNLSELMQPNQNYFISQYECTLSQNNNLNDLLMYIEPLRNFLEVLQKVPGYSIDIFLKRVPRLINEPYTKEMGIKIAKKVTEKGMVRLVKIAAGAHI